jgi:hypothetical protein
MGATLPRIGAGLRKHRRVPNLARIAVQRSIGDCMTLFSELIRFLLVCLALLAAAYALHDAVLPNSAASAEHWQQEQESTFRPIVFEP